MRTPLFKPIVIGGIIALLLMAGYYWSQRGQVRASSSQLKPAAGTPERTESTAATPVATDAPDSSAIDTVSGVSKPIRKETPKPAAPMRTNKPDPPMDRPAASVQKPALVEAVKEPVPPPCDQLVMRDGDLIDAKILEVGVDEIRYRKCRREDGPEYVVSKSNVLSIRFANGDVDRF